MSAVNSKLKTYRKKRDFTKTLEPFGKTRKKDTAIFVIQKHDASHLHYDLRLEIDGVLKSWAVPKGPPTKAGDKKLAMLTEDHPMEYAKFHGTIPEGEYGAGTVEIWDHGKYENLKEQDMSRCFKDGKIEIILKGKKVKGKYALIKTKLSEGKGWLLLKMKENGKD
ncbi:3'-phosphoesterase [Candidatus Dependentiae bacterium]|nr:3'-phosphoesterase [Candidatus Dependentiae bacterium]